MAKDNPRATARKFFSLKPKEARSPWLFWAIAAAAIGWGYVAIHDGDAVVPLVLFVLTALPLVLLARWLKKRQQRKAETKLGELANTTRDIQSKDAVDAFLRIFKRTQLQIEDLRTLDHQYEFDKERDLFSEESLESRLGELYNCSIRMWSQGTSKENARFKRVIWDQGHREDFYNPLRAVALFLTDDELVICDTEIDSLDGNLNENISRTMLSDVVSIGFSNSRDRFSMDDQTILQLAEDMNYDKKEIAKIKASLESRDEQDPEYMHEVTKSWLNITRKDSRDVSFPIRQQVFFGKRGSTDGDSELSEDDQTIDRMVNELNRLVRSAKR